MKIFGILNITPDSFSDGGSYTLPELAKCQADIMLNDGAFAIDLGAESTRPGAEVLSNEDEWNRLKPILDILKDVPLSVDTCKPTVAKNCLNYPNVEYINDVSGFSKPEMVEVLKSSKAQLIVMHSLTVPADKNIILETPPVETLLEWIKDKYNELTNAGIAANRIIFDPGLGFGKNPEQSRKIIARAQELADYCHSLGTKLLFGHSRKSFIGGDVKGRDSETAAISADLLKKGVDFIRVHNVELNSKSLKENGY